MKLVSSQRQPSCPVCGKGPLTTRSDREISIGPKGQRVTVTGLEYSVCEACHASVVLPAQLRANQAKVRDAQSKLIDYISPAQVLQLRETYEISQQVAAQIFGGGRNAFSKYERGEVTPSAGAARNMLRALRDPSFFATLAHEKGFPTGQLGVHTSESHPDCEQILSSMPQAAAVAIRSYSEEHRVSLASAIAKFAADGARVVRTPTQAHRFERLNIKERHFYEALGVSNKEYVVALEPREELTRLTHKPTAVPYPIRLGSQRYDRKKRPAARNAPLRGRC
ncbi:type II toxin-antitoxin system MqsA family antitoxin [Burkholderia ubonensis]|uniref:type II toxin-antitoxin system MqsA family antitoxin n=1 Tax=Burkholderia ubonensis TaxID=101571 RepID=UPI0009B4CADA|nr:type II toxin-antitoxin system MqsA family antitoxin [Burkholderia ubonensis]